MSGPNNISSTLSNGTSSDKEKSKKSRRLKFSVREEPILVWDEKVANTNLEDFRKKVSEKCKIQLNNYWDFHKWSVEHFENFWEEAWNYFSFITSNPYEEIYRKTGEAFTDVEWFPGLQYNAAENLIRIRDNSTAIIYADEIGNEEKITYAELYEEVKLYAAAFRKHGLKKGDIVACYMSNIKETIFIYIATLSIGAIFSGPQPYFGARPASNIIKKLEPKFLFSVDHHTENGIGFHNIDHLPLIAEETLALEKVIIVPTRQDTFNRDISNIRNGCFLQQFLEAGFEPDGGVPEIVFEQLSFNHPVAINFTSGTTGLPKGPVHSAGTLLTELLSIVFYWNMKPGDVLFTCYPNGWTLFNTFVCGLAWGIKLFLYAGSAYYINQDRNIWDVFAKYKVAHALMITSALDKLEKLDAQPAPNSNLDSLRSITIGGSPVKASNCLYVLNKVKKDIFVGSQYGATEQFGCFTGIDLNLPSYAGENQVPALGMNIQCFDSEGKSVIGERGEMVLVTPTPTLPIYIFKDQDNSILKSLYLSDFPGVWYQHDEIFINPETKGLIVIGRSDDTLKQYGERFAAGDVYSAIHDMEEIQDYICVGQTRSDNEMRAVLFIKMKEGHLFTPEFRKRVEKKIFDELWVDCVPQVILETKDIPYNLNNKKMESVVRKIIATNQIPQVNNIRNPGSLSHFCNIPELMNF